MNNQSRIVLAFIAGAAVGAAVTYLLTSEKGADAVEEFRRMADKLKNDLSEKLGKRKPGTGPAPASGPEQAEDFMGV
jgi:gas vesicle protein